jgi:hypothetical protein
MAVDWDTLLIGPTVACFGVPVTYTTPALTFPIVGVFDEAYKELVVIAARDSHSFSDEMLGSAITAERPVLGVQLSQFPPGNDPAQSDTLVVRGALYIVKEVRPDGHGWARLLLNELDDGTG